MPAGLARERADWEGGHVRPRLLAFVIGPALVLSLWALSRPAPTAATHSWGGWGGYHWARLSNPFTLPLGDNVSSIWDPYLATAASDWSASNVLDATVVPGGTSPRNCRPTAGRVEVCNASYGNNGWLGLAQIWASGAHITQGTVKLNDFYFSRQPYNSPAWRQMVVCQEVGHTLGLDHQDENFSNPNLGTCMDYTSDPSTNQHPNQGDYNQLSCIYDPAAAGQTLTTSTHTCTGTGHLDSTTTVRATISPGPGFGQAVADQAGDTPAEWGVPVRARADGRPILYRRDLAPGHALFTWVTWADIPAPPPRGR